MTNTEEAYPGQNLQRMERRLLDAADLLRIKARRLQEEINLLVTEDLHLRAEVRRMNPNAEFHHSYCQRIHSDASPCPRWVAEAVVKGIGLEFLKPLEKAWVSRLLKELGDDGLVYIIEELITTSQEGSLNVGKRP